MECYTECEVSQQDYLESRLAQMTFWAHKTVLFEKIKEQIEKQEGAKLEKIAELLVSASNTKAKDEREVERRDEEFRDKIRDAFEE